MSDSEIVRFLAEKCMGWEVPMQRLDNGDCWLKDSPRIFNPLDSIADAFEVQAAFSGDRNRQSEYARWVQAIIMAERSTCVWGDADYLYATPRQRSLAAVRALGGEL